MTIHCSHDELVPLARLDTMRHPKNPNTHGAAQIAAIAAVFEGNGIRAPVVVSRRSNLITRGHGRLDSALMLGLEHFPVNFQDYADEAAEINDMLADNRLAELAGIDDAKLAEVLKELHDQGHDLNLAGFTDEDFAALTNAEAAVSSLESVPRMEMQPFEHYDYLVFMFRDIRDWLRVLQLLKIVKVNFSITRTTSKIGIGRVLNGNHLLKRLEDSSRNPVAGPGGESDNAPADTGSVPDRSEE